MSRGGAIKKIQIFFEGGVVLTPLTRSARIDSHKISSWIRRTRYHPWGISQFNKIKSIGKVLEGLQFNRHPGNSKDLASKILLFCPSFLFI